MTYMTYDVCVGEIVYTYDRSVILYSRTIVPMVAVASVEVSSSLDLLFFLNPFEKLSTVICPDSENMLY